MEQLDIDENWRFWPVICIALLYPINNSLIGLAIPLYFFRQGLDVRFIGIIAAGTAMTYCFSPLLFKNVADKIGRKSCVVIALLGTSLAQLTFYFTLDPMMFFISRLSEGLITGLFWPNLQASISDNAFQDHNRKLSRFNFGWNSGVLIGFLTGALILFVIDDLKIIFLTAPLLVFSATLISILLFQESKKYNTNIVDQERIKGNLHSNINNSKYRIPKILPVLLVASYAFAKGSINILYPIKSEIIGFEVYTVYLLAAFTLITQLISTTFASYLSINSLKKAAVSCLFSLIIIFIFYGITTNFLIFAVLYLLMGFFAGILISFGIKLSLMQNVKYQASKYSNILESSIGLTFLITPILAAYLASNDLTLAFYIISLGFTVFLVSSLILLRNLQTEE
ncbi:MAG: MFS transporter [Promethearchaeota archaeon]